VRAIIFIVVVKLNLYLKIEELHRMYTFEKNEHSTKMKILETSITNLEKESVMEYAYDTVCSFNIS
jgi:hypothetical protein